jgi:hypothetical protein
MFRFHYTIRHSFERSQRWPNGKKDQRSCTNYKFGEKVTDGSRGDLSVRKDRVLHLRIQLHHAVLHNVLRMEYAQPKPSGEYLATAQ